MRQDDTSLTKYYATMKCLCGDIVALEAHCMCNYADKDRVLAQSNRDSLIKCFNGLNEQYDAIRDQIFLLVPCFCKLRGKMPLRLRLR